MQTQEPAKLLNLSDRLNYVLELTGTKKADLAKAINVKPQVVHFLSSSATVASRFTFEIASALGLNTRWLATGEGEIFLADDPKYKLLKDYELVPLIDFQALQDLVSNGGQDPSKIETGRFSLIRCNLTNMFSTQMPDSSMEPIIPKDAEVFFTHYDQTEKINENTLVLAYLPHYRTLVIREVILENDSYFLAPSNLHLFKKLELTTSIKIVALVIECHWRKS